MDCYIIPPVEAPAAWRSRSNFGSPTVTIPRWPSTGTDGSSSAGWHQTSTSRCVKSALDRRRLAPGGLVRWPGPARQAGRPTDAAASPAAIGERIVATAGGETRPLAARDRAAPRRSLAPSLLRPHPLSAGPAAAGDQRPRAPRAETGFRFAPDWYPLRREMTTSRSIFEAGRRYRWITPLVYDGGHLVAEAWKIRP